MTHQAIAQELEQLGDEHTARRGVINEEYVAAVKAVQQKCAGIGHVLTRNDMAWVLHGLNSSNTTTTIRRRCVVCNANIAEEVTQETVERA